MVVKCGVCERDKPKRKVIKRIPSLEVELPEKYNDYREFKCKNIISELGKDKKWHESVCKNRMLVLRKQ
jgi:hypothetical protein